MAEHCIGSVSTDIESISRDLKDQQQRIQLKTFTKWINHTLSRNGSSNQITDLQNEIKDGVVLLEILEILTNEKLIKEKQSSTRRPLQINKLNNVSTALDFLQRKGVKLVNINCTDVVNGKPAIILGLLWKIILHVQIRGTLDEDIITNRYNNNIGHYRNSVLNAKDFGPSWRNGILFNKLVNTIKPGVVDTDIIKPENARQNLHAAFKIAEKELDIPPLLDPEDVDVDKPDEVSIMTYVGEFIKKYPKGVDDSLKKTLLTRAERLSSSVVDDVVDNSINTRRLYQRQKCHVVPLTLAIVLVLLYRYLWLIVALILTYDTLFG